MKIKGAFMFIAPSGEEGAKVKSSWTCTESVDVLTIGVSSYKQAVEMAEKVVKDEGCTCIELCAGFGHEGAAMVAKAVNVPVGVVRFDTHPGLNNVSGDKIFGVKN